MKITREYRCFCPARRQGVLTGKDSSQLCRKVVYCRRGLLRFLPATKIRQLLLVMLLRVRVIARACRQESKAVMMLPDFHAEIDCLKLPALRSQDIAKESGTELHHGYRGWLFCDGGKEGSLTQFSWGWWVNRGGDCFEGGLKTVEPLAYPLATSLTRSNGRRPNRPKRTLKAQTKKRKNDGNARHR